MSGSDDVEDVHADGAGDDHDGDDGDGGDTGAPPPDALSRLVALLAEERVIQPSLADFLR